MKAFVINLKERPERLSDFRSIDLPFEVEHQCSEKKDDGSLGCILSHMECYKRFESGINIIFEDDCEMVSDIDIMFKAFDELGEDWDMLYLGAMVHGPIFKNTEHTDHVKDAWTTHAIAYNGRKVADHILGFSASHIRASRRNIDTFLVYEIQKNPSFRCFLTNPQIFIQKENYSDVINQQRIYEWKYGR